MLTNVKTLTDSRVRNLIGNHFSEREQDIVIIILLLDIFINYINYDYYDYYLM